MDAEKFYKTVAVLVAVAAVTWLVAYYLATKSSDSPAPDRPAGQYTQEKTDAERRALLESLRAPTTQELSLKERNNALKSLKAPSESELSEAERMQVLQSLKAK